MTKEKTNRNNKPTCCPNGFGGFCCIYKSKRAINISNTLSFSPTVSRDSCHDLSTAARSLWNQQHRHPVYNIVFDWNRSRSSEHSSASHYTDWISHSINDSTKIIRNTFESRHWISNISLGVRLIAMPCHNQTTTTRILSPIIIGILFALNQTKYI